MRFNYIKDIGKFLIVDSSLGEESTIDFIIKNKIENLSFNQYDGFLEGSLYSFSKIKTVKRIEVIKDKITPSEIIGFENLTYLYLSTPVTGKIDFISFKSLEYLNIEWNNKVQNFENLTFLKELVLRKYNGKPEGLAELKKLESLSIIQGKIDSLFFVKSLKNLRMLQLSYLKNLTQIEPLSNTGLIELEIDSCKKINYLDTLSELKQVKKLIISNSSPIPNLNFIKYLKRLEYFSFVGTTIEDGDLTLCAKLKYVGFDDKRHYNYRNREGRAILRK